MSESKAHTCLLGFLNITDDGESLELSDDDNKDHVDIWLIDESLCEFESGKESKTDVLRQKSINFVTKSNILFYFHFFTYFSNLPTDSLQDKLLSALPDLCLNRTNWLIP